MPKERIQKVLSAAGVASRRASEEMILEGRITVNGRLVKELPCFVEPGDDVRVDGRKVDLSEERNVYYLLNKPKGVVCTQSDPRGRRRAVDLLPEAPQRVYCVGRLDQDSTGVILLTNDGELTQYLTHPRYGVEKRYVVEVDGRVGEAEMDRLKTGMWLDGKKTQSAKVKVLKRGPKRSMLEIQLREGKNREIRRLLARLGHKVRRLKRTAIGPVTDRGLKVGNVRRLTRGEVARLRQSGRDEHKGKRRKRGRK